MESSRMRPVARAINRFATFAQAISSTKPTAVSSTINAPRTSPIDNSFEESTRMAQPLDDG
jgi:hypothetical protein